ncbi:hypothetical protein WA026_020239, partial [Henosepilachna vigintioctopunctata]
KSQGICLIASGHNLMEVCNQINKSLADLHNCLSLRDMKISPNKCKADDPGPLRTALLRRRLLASKYLPKAVHAKNPIAEILTELKNHMSIWRNLNIPEVVKCSARINDLKEQLDCTKIPRCFQTNLTTQYKKIKYTKNNLEKTNMDNSAEFMKFKSIYHEYTTLYTDDPQNGGNMGLRIYCPDRNIKLSGSLPDSLSALEKISNQKINVKNDEITMLTRDRIIEIKNLGWKVMLIWIPQPYQHPRE